MKIPKARLAGDSETAGALPAAVPVPVRATKRGDRNGPLCGTLSVAVSTASVLGVNVTLIVQLASWAKVTPERPGPASPSIEMARPSWSKVTRPEREGSRRRQANTVAPAGRPATACNARGRSAP